MTDRARGDIGQRWIYIYAVRTKHKVFRLELKRFTMEKNEAWLKTQQVAAGWGVPAKSKRKRKHNCLKKTIVQIHGRSMILFSAVRNGVLVLKLISNSFVIT